MTVRPRHPREESTIDEPIDTRHARSEMMEYSASFLDYGPLAQQSSRATSEVLDRDRRHGHVRTLRPERSQPHSMSSPRLISSYGSDNGAGYASRRESTDFNHIASRNETSSLPGQQQVTFERELSTLIPRQISYTSALVGTSFGASGFPENSSYVPRAYLPGIQGSFDGASDLDNTGRTEGRSEFVPQRQVDVYSDGLYLNAASKDSFIGVSLSPPPPTREVISTVQFEKAPSQSETTSTPRSPSRHAKLSCFKTPMTVRSLSTPLSSEQPRALSFESSTQAHGDYPRGLKALSKTLTDVAYDVRSPTKQRIAEPRTKELRRTSVTSYSSLKKGSGRKPAHDFEVVIVERESSGESSEDGDRNDLEFASGYPKEHSAAVKAVDIFREWKVESIAQEQQRLDWETYGKLEQASGSIRFKTAWTKDLLLRNCQRQIQAKLRGKLCSL